MMRSVSRGTAGFGGGGLLLFSGPVVHGPRDSDPRRARPRSEQLRSASRTVPRLRNSGRLQLQGIDW
jgi:hypothetical protein